jgi:hypothetical protein
MNHYSDSPAILWYVDSVSHYYGLYILKGWMIHTNKSIKSIEIDGKDVITYRNSREDVKEVYPYVVNADEIGFELTLEESQIYKPLNVRLSDNTTMKIEIFIGEILQNSPSAPSTEAALFGFSNTHSHSVKPLKCLSRAAFKGITNDVVRKSNTIQYLKCYSTTIFSSLFHVAELLIARG